MLEQGCETFIRYNDAISILRKIQEKREDNFIKFVSSRKPFGLATNFNEFTNISNDKTIKIFANNNISFVDINKISKGKEFIKDYKIFITKAYGAGEDFPHQILNKPILAEPYSCCTETFIMIGTFKTIEETKNALSYIKSKFFRFLVMLKKILKMLQDKFINLSQFKISTKNGQMKNCTKNMVLRKRKLIL